MHDKKETQIIIHTTCNFLRVALESVSTSVIKKLMPQIDAIVFVDTRIIGRKKIPFFINSEKIIFIYLTDDTKPHACNCISLSEKLCDFFNKIYNLFMMLNTNQVQQAMFWAKNNMLLSLTQKELSTVYLLCKGFSIKQVAFSEQISVKAVYVRIASVKQKTDCISIPMLKRAFATQCDVISKLIKG